MNRVQDNNSSWITDRDAWDALPMENKAEMMKVAVRNGIYDLQTIRDKYNEFAEGGDADWSYNSWKQQISKYLGLNIDEDNTYDYEGYFNKYPKEAWAMLKGSPDAHFTDEFKTVYHPTFSQKSLNNDGSIYSGVVHPKYNPQGLVGGTWSPDYKTFTMSMDGYRSPVSMDDRKWYLENAEDGGVQLREADGSLPIYDNVPWVGVLPTVTITGNKHSIEDPLVEAAMNEYKHGEGGNLFDGISQPTQQMQLGSDYWQTQTNQPTFFEALDAYNAQKQQEAVQRKVELKQWAATKGREIIDKRSRDYHTASNDATSNAATRLQNKHLEERAIEGAKAHAAWEKDNPTMTTIGLGLSTVPFAVASIPAGEALASTAAGQLATKVLSHPISEAVGVAMAGGHGLSDLFSGNANAMTALELAPLAFPYGNFIKGTGEAINFVGSKIPAPIKDAWANRAETAAMYFGNEGKTWAKVIDPKGKEGVVFLNENNNWKTAADWILHPQQTFRDYRSGYYPMTKNQWKDYFKKEREAMDFAKQKSVELNNAQMNQRLSLQQESFKDHGTRRRDATIKIVDDPTNIFAAPRAPRNASEVADNVRVISSRKGTSYGGKWFEPKFGTGIAAVSHPDKNVIILPRFDQTKFSNRLAAMPTRGYTSPIETRMHTYVHELQHQMQQNLPLLNLSQYNDATKYYEPWDHFLRNIDSENLLQPFKDTASKYPGSWLASPNEYNAESNAFRVVDDYKGKRGILDPLDWNSASRLNNFGLNFDQIESLWNMGYKEGGHLRKRI